MADEEVAEITGNEEAGEMAANYDAEFWGVGKEEEPAEAVMEAGKDSEIDRAQQTTEDEVAAAEESAQLPEKYRGKSTAEIARMHQNLERFLGIPAAERQLAMQQAGIIADAEALVTGDETKNLVIDDAAVTRQQPIAQQRYGEIMQREKARLEALGYENSKVAQELQQQQESFSAAAWSYAQQQDSYLQSAIQQGIQSALGELLPIITPAIGDKLYADDVASYFQSVPVHGVTADEVTTEISRAGINPLEWRKADNTVKAAFIDRATKEIFYAKSLRNQTATAAASSVKAPAQTAPASVTGSGSSIKLSNNRLSQAFAGYLDPADLHDL